MVRTMDAMLGWYNGIMAKTEIEELIEAIKAQPKTWLKPRKKRRPSNRTWNEILDGRPYPQIKVDNP